MHNVCFRWRFTHCACSLQLVRDCHNLLRLSNEQLTALLALCDEWLDTTDKQHMTFALLRAIVARQLVVPQLYDGACFFLWFFFGRVVPRRV